MIEPVTAPPTPAHVSTHRRFRFVVIVVSLVGVIAGSAFLATYHRHEVKTPTATVLIPALPPGGKVVARIPIGRANEALGQIVGGALAVGEGAVWVMNDATSTLMRIDPARSAIVARIKVEAPEAIAAGDGAVWLTNPSYNTVTRVDPATNTVTATVPVGPLPEGIAVSPGAVWVTDAGAPSVSRINPATNQVVATIRLGPKRDCCAEHMNIATSPSAVWVAFTNGESIVHIDPATNRIVSTASLGYQPCGFLATDQTGVWSTSEPQCGGSVVARVDSQTNKLMTNLDELDPVGIAVAFRSVWVAASGNVDQIDPHSGRIVARLQLGGGPVQLGVGFGSIWVSDSAGRVLRIKPSEARDDEAG